ncbi:MAG: hypothetical protein ACOVQA_11140 [Thermoflexibacteraceae bacterium]
MNKQLLLLLLTLLVTFVTAKASPNAKIFTIVDAKQREVHKIYLNSKNIVYLTVGKNAQIDFQGLEFKTNDPSVQLSYMAREKKLEIIPLATKVVLQVMDNFLKKQIDEIELEVIMIPFPSVQVKAEPAHAKPDQYTLHLLITPDPDFSILAPQDDEVVCNAFAIMLKEDGKILGEKKVFVTKKNKNDFVLNIPKDNENPSNKVLLTLKEFSRINYKKGKTFFSYEWSETLTIE